MCPIYTRTKRLLPSPPLLMLLLSASSGTIIGRADRVGTRRFRQLHIRVTIGEGTNQRRVPWTRNPGEERHSNAAPKASLTCQLAIPPSPCFLRGSNNDNARFRRQRKNRDLEEAFVFLHVLRILPAPPPQAASGRVSAAVRPQWIITMVGLTEPALRLFRRSTGTGIAFHSSGQVNYFTHRAICVLCAQCCWD